MTPADTALALFAAAPQALGGVRLRARAGPEREAWLAALRGSLPAATPWHRLPAHTDDESLHGALDLAATLAQGRVVRSAGLLVRVRGGLLLAALAERMPGALAARLNAVLDDPDAAPPQRVALIALDEGLDAEEVPPESLLDRLGLHVTLEAGRMPAAVDAECIAQARQRWRAVQVGDDLVEALVEAADSLGVASPRASWCALVATRVAAALAGRDRAEAADASQAVQTVLLPRATRWPTPENDAAPPPPEPPRDEAAPNADDPAADDGPLGDRLVEAARAALPAQLLALLQSGGARRSRAEAAGAGSVAASRQRGRPVGSLRGQPRGGARLALIDTLRCAAPWQRVRRAALAAPPGRVIVQRDDLRIQRREQRRGTTTIFAIDASGSQAMHRLAEAKGAVELLLADCYARRDRVAVIGFRGTGASVLLAPTRSLVRAKRQLAGLPGGGGTPLALGIDAARAMAEAVSRGGATPLVVLLTDGRGNITRRGEPGREQAAADAMTAARMLASHGVATLLIDTAPQPAAMARTLADALQARYLPLPHAGARALSAAVRVERGSAGPGAGRGR
jgi:magnesium chelatase subunit D